MNSTMFQPNLVSTPMHPSQQHQQQQQQGNYGSGPNASFSNTSLQGPQQGYQAATPNSTMMPPAPFQQNPNLSYTGYEPFSYSPKHNGLYLYLSRILRPIWGLNCVEKVTADGKKIYVSFRKLELEL